MEHAVGRTQYFRLTAKQVEKERRHGSFATLSPKTRITIPADPARPLLDSPDGDKSVWLSPPFEVVAQTRNAEGKDWGLLLRWYDPDNV